MNKNNTKKHVFQSSVPAGYAKVSLILLPQINSLQKVSRWALRGPHFLFHTLHFTVKQASKCYIDKISLVR